MLQSIPKNQQYQKQMNLEFLKQAIKNHPISHTNNCQNVEKIKINEYINNNVNKNINNSKKKQEQRSHTHSVVSHHIKLQNQSSFSTLDPENQSTTQNTSPKKKCQQSSYFHSSINSQYINKQQQQKLQENQTQKNEKETNQESAYLPKNFRKNIKNQNKYNLNKNQTTQQFFQPRKNHFSAQLKSYSHSNFSSFDLNNSPIQQNQPQQQQNQLQFSNLSNQQQQNEDQKQQEQFFSSNDITIQSIKQEQFLESLNDEISCQSLLFSQNPTNQNTNRETQDNQYNQKEEIQQDDQHSQDKKNQKNLLKTNIPQFDRFYRVQKDFFKPKLNQTLLNQQLNLPPPQQAIQRNTLKLNTNMNTNYFKSNKIQINKQEQSITSNFNSTQQEIKNINNTDNNDKKNKSSNSKQNKVSYQNIQFPTQPPQKNIRNYQKIGRIFNKSQNSQNLNKLLKFKANLNTVNSDHVNNEKNYSENSNSNSNNNQNIFNYTINNNNETNQNSDYHNNSFNNNKQLRKNYMKTTSSIEKNMYLQYMHQNSSQKLQNKQCQINKQTNKNLQNFLSQQKLKIQGIKDYLNTETSVTFENIDYYNNSKNINNVNNNYNQNFNQNYIQRQLYNKQNPEQKIKSACNLNVGQNKSNNSSLTPRKTDNVSQIGPKFTNFLQNLKQKQQEKQKQQILEKQKKINSNSCKHILNQYKEKEINFSQLATLNNNNNLFTNNQDKQQLECKNQYLKTDDNSQSFKQQIKSENYIQTEVQGNLNLESEETDADFLSTKHLQKIDEIIKKNSHFHKNLQKTNSNSLDNIPNKILQQQLETFGAQKSFKNPNFSVPKKQEENTQIQNIQNDQYNFIQQNKASNLKQNQKFQRTFKKPNEAQNILPKTLLQQKLKCEKQHQSLPQQRFKQPQKLENQTQKLNQNEFLNLTQNHILDKSSTISQNTILKTQREKKLLINNHNNKNNSQKQLPKKLEAIFNNVVSQTLKNNKNLQQNQQYQNKFQQLNPDFQKNNAFKFHQTKLNQNINMQNKLTNSKLQQQLLQRQQQQQLQKQQQLQQQQTQLIKKEQQIQQQQNQHLESNLKNLKKFNKKQNQQKNQENPNEAYLYTFGPHNILLNDQVSQFL